jgi:NADPH:quinone reductase-like Zn-dependent oxidoreductase
MKAMLMTNRGTPDVLQLGSIPDLEPGPGEVLVRVRATALNHLDVWVRKGVASPKLPLPHILGCDIAGEILAFGPRTMIDEPGMQTSSLDTLEVGARVMVNPGLSCGRCHRCLAGRDNLCASYRIIGEHTRGGYAEMICVPRANLVPIPDNLSFSSAAAIPLAALTAWQMVVDKARVKPGERVLVMAAGSGVSSWAIQMVKLFGGIVIATASTDEKLEHAKKLGADFTINYAQEDYGKRIKALTDGEGVEVALDHTGADNWAKTIKSLAWGGRMVTCGATSGNEASTPLAHVFFKQLEILGSTMGCKADLFQILEFVNSGKLQPIVDQVVPLENAREAHVLMESRAFFGKIVLEV